MSLQPGACLVFYTDGVTDQGLGVTRSPVQAIKRLSGERSAAALADALRNEAGESASTPRDDVAVVALRYLPSADAAEGAPGLTVGTATA